MMSTEARKVRIHWKKTYTAGFLKGETRGVTSRVWSHAVDTWVALARDLEQRGVEIHEWDGAYTMSNIVVESADYDTTREVTR